MRKRNRRIRSQSTEQNCYEKYYCMPKSEMESYWGKTKKYYDESMKKHYDYMTSNHKEAMDCCREVKESVNKLHTKVDSLITKKKYG